MDSCLYSLGDLIEEVRNRYPSNNEVFSILFVDKFATEQSFIELNSDENFIVMLNMYDEEKEVTIYVTTDPNHVVIERQQTYTRSQDEAIDESHDEDDSYICPSEESYHSHHSSDNEKEEPSYVKENFSRSKKIPTMKVNSTFQNVVEFRRSLNHFALAHEFEYFIEKSEPTQFTARCSNMQCEWRIHASIMQDNVTFEVRKHIETHTCIRSNKGGNKHVTQGWIASIIKDKMKSDGEVSVAELTKWLMKNYNVDHLPYHKVYRGKEQAYTDMYGKWEDSFLQIYEFKEELRNRNPESVVDIKFETKDGCRPYISFDGCHLKEKFNGVLVAATGIDGNNCLYPKAIGMPNGLVISSDMQKGLEVAIMQVYPDVEHRECIRHLYSNFKKHFRGEFFNSRLYGAAMTYSVSQHDKLLGEIGSVSKEAITYLNENHKRVWSRCKFGTLAKCDYITNNTSESFNSWIGEFRYLLVLDLLDSIREKLMVQFDKKRRTIRKWKGMLVPKAKNYLRRVSKNLGEYTVCRSSDTQAEVKYKGKRWEVTLNEKNCTCRVWQITGLLCVHAAAVIAFMRYNNWDTYVDPYFTIQKYKQAYELEIVPLRSKDEWVHIETTKKIFPPIIKRPPGRPRKNRIQTYEEPKRRHKCCRCGEFGHHQKRYKNPESQTSQSSHQYKVSKSKRL
uniref:uncharacterized protein LOC122604691 n=1 Tax=Erigeron canadensis TaxID=72917 RepID=UPI001CB9057E|nr:uncharacterized protein LOC122604691 [Erigeron canadensis]